MVPQWYSLRALFCPSLISLSVGRRSINFLFVILHNLYLYALYLLIARTCWCVSCARTCVLHEVHDVHRAARFFTTRREPTESAARTNSATQETQEIMLKLAKTEQIKEQRACKRHVRQRWEEQLRDRQARHKKSSRVVRLARPLCRNSREAITSHVNGHFGCSTHDSAIKVVHCMRLFTFDKRRPLKSLSYQRIAQSTPVSIVVLRNDCRLSHY